MEKREQFRSRLGFLLIAAGCAIGLGNVWRFPYITGQNGGAVFVIIYLFFLLILGVPLLTAELAVGRASRRSIAQAFNVLETPGSKWHLNKYWMIPGSYILMSFYGLLTGWMLYYCVRFITGQVPTNITEEAASAAFGELLASPLSMFVAMTTVVVVAFAIVAFGVVRGIERITKPMMLALLALLVFMAVRSFTMPGFAEGVAFYLRPDFSIFSDKDLLINALWAAMGQAFFTLSVGQGSIEIFGSYINRDHSLLSEGVLICALDTVVALLAGFVIFPACFSYGVEPTAGPGLLFVTLNTVFSNMEWGAMWGGLFFLFMLFAALSTLVGVFEAIIAMSMELFGITRKRAVVANFIAIMLLSIPALLGFNVLSFVQPMGEGSCIMDLQDFIISNNILVLGSFFFVCFITARTGMGFQRYLEESNSGEGLKVPAWIYPYLRYVLPCIILVLWAVGIAKVLL
ncbi:MAG: sodium-dependent transporter [Succinivibrionaceae bacterium]|nr:sodium-dependent transporter [Succinivibrionaceae bacterium]